MQMANQNWNGWKFQIHWDKLEWVNPRIRNEKKPTLCAFQKFYLMQKTLSQDFTTCHCPTKYYETK